MSRRRSTYQAPRGGLVPAIAAAGLFLMLLTTAAIALAITTLWMTGVLK